MPRRMLFPLRRCPGLVPIRELDLDIVVVVIEPAVSQGGRTIAGVLRQSQRSTSPVIVTHE